MHYPSYEEADCFAKYSGIHAGYELITIEQWRNWYNEKGHFYCADFGKCGHTLSDGPCTDCGKQEYGWKELAPDELITGGDLEGYEAPFDIGVGFSKGHVVKISNKVDNRYGSYSDIPENGKMWFSAEWVERDWKPVYKAKEKKRVPKSGWVIQVVGGLGIPILDGSTSRPALFNTQADCIEWVKKNGMLEEFYTFLEVDYITEE